MVESRMNKLREGTSKQLFNTVIKVARCPAPPYRAKKRHNPERETERERERENKKKEKKENALLSVSSVCRPFLNTSKMHKEPRRKETKKEGTVKNEQVGRKTGEKVRRKEERRKEKEMFIHSYFQFGAVAQPLAPGDRPGSRSSLVPIKSEKSLQRRRVVKQNEMNFDR